jgi:hypothetical protein
MRPSSTRCRIEAEPQHPRPKAGGSIGSAPASAVECKPAQLVAQPLVVEHKFSDLVGELSALPLALQAANRLALVFSRCRPRRSDRVGRSTELVGRHMAPTERIVSWGIA